MPDGVDPGSGSVMTLPSLSRYVVLDLYPSRSSPVQAYGTKTAPPPSPRTRTAHCPNGTAVSQLSVPLPADDLLNVRMVCQLMGSPDWLNSFVMSIHNFAE